MKEIEIGVYDVPIILSSSLEPKRSWYQQMVINAQKNIKEIAKAYQWDHLINTPFMDRVQIFDKQNDFINELYDTLHLDRSFQLPKTVSAVLEHNSLVSVSSSEYQRLYPIEGNDPKGFERLLTHEMAHHLHIRILNGNEELMGPKWFYEGFAIFVSKQFPGFICEEDEIWDIILNQKDVSYKYYAIIFNYLTRYFSLNQLVEKAKMDDFIEWLKINLKK